MRAGSAEARGLGKALLPDELIQRIGSWSHVYVVGADLLDNPPLELLPFSESSLGCEVAVMHLPSLPIGVHLARKVGAPQLAGKDAMALFAGPHPSNEAQDLWPSIGPITVQGGAWDDLMDPFPHGQSQVWSEQQATRVAFLERFPGGSLEVGGTKVLTLFCHGVFDYETEDLPAGLVLGASEVDNGLVWASDVTGDFLAPELVILAACGTSRGPQRRGENGMANLGGAFLHAGASTVIMAGGSLEVEAAFALVEVLHRELARGETIAEAMRIARQELEQGAGNSGLGVPLSILGVGHRALFLAPERTGSGLAPWALVGVAAIGAGLVLLVNRRNVSSLTQ